MKIFFKIKNTFFLPHTLKTDSQVRNFGVIQIQIFFFCGKTTDPKNCYHLSVSGGGASYKTKTY